MELRDHKFYFAGEAMDFAVFSNGRWRANYMDSIALPISRNRVDIYEIEPGADTQWVVVRQRDCDTNRFRFFVRKREEFLEKKPQRLSKTLKKEILQKFPKLGEEFELPWAA